MSKWADFGISRASYTDGLVESLDVRADPGSRIGDRETWTREQVVAALVLGATIVTMREVSVGGWMKVDVVRLVTVGKELYVRVDGNVAMGDNLGKLDE